jgi:lysophospholipase L1-like esterase
MEDMVRTKKGSLNFYHIGGSHLQADIYTHDVRTMMQTNWNKLPGERGWVFPFKLAGTNNPWNYTFTSSNEWKGYRSVVRGHKTEDFGTLGIKIVCPDSLINIQFEYDRTEVKPRFNKIRIFHNKGFFPFDLNWGNDEILWWRQHTNENLGFTEITFMENLDDFDLQLARKTSLPYDLEIYGFQLMNDDPGISYTAIGVNGAGLYTYLDCERFEEQLKTYPPDFFAFSVGTNDANVPNGDFVPETYYDNLEKMMQIVLRANPNCAILLTVPNDALYRRRYLNYNVGKERDMIELLAAKYQVPVWDLYGMMGGVGSSRTWYRNGLMKSDHVHFTTEGYHLKGELYFDAFKKFLLQFGQRKLNYIRSQEDGGDQ